MARRDVLEEDLREVWLFALTAGVLVICTEFAARLPQTPTALVVVGRVLGGLIAAVGLRLSFSCLVRSLTERYGWILSGKCLFAVAVHVGALVPTGWRIVSAVLSRG